MEKIRGVNLGNWLVLEKWMTPALFDGVDAEDETYLCLRLGRERAAERLKVHRDGFITQRDFEDIAVKGSTRCAFPFPSSSLRMWGHISTATSTWIRPLTGRKNSY